MSLRFNLPEFCLTMEMAPARLGQWLLPVMLVTGWHSRSGSTRSSPVNSMGPLEPSSPRVNYLTGYCILEARPKLAMQPRITLSVVF